MNTGVAAINHDSLMFYGLPRQVDGATIIRPWQASAPTVLPLQQPECNTQSGGRTVGATAQVVYLPRSTQALRKSVRGSNLQRTALPVVGLSKQFDYYILLKVK